MKNLKRDLVGFIIAAVESENEILLSTKKMISQKRIFFNQVVLGGMELLFPGVDFGS